MPAKQFAQYAWFVVGYNLFVILVGAFVRATGSGAGCGSHWPTCNGEIIPRPEEIETLIEFTHRLTSSLAGVFVIILLVWALRLKPSIRFVRWMAIFSFIFILIEGWLGAMLVRYDLVVDNASTARVIVIGLHLTNTLILVAFLTLTAWGASNATSHIARRHVSGGILLGLLVGLLAFVVLSAAGAVTALGDTLFPAESLRAGIRDDFTISSHFLVRMRVWHPILAVATSAYLYIFGFWLLRRIESDVLETRIQLLFIVIATQVGAGILNIVLLAPVWMQIVHLLLADTLWILLVIIAAEVLLKEKKVKELA